jgi:hypothetical protein
VEVYKQLEIVHRSSSVITHLSGLQSSESVAIQFLLSMQFFPSHHAQNPSFDPGDVVFAGQHRGL